MTNSFSKSARLKWVRHESNWWPAIAYDSYGQALQHVGSRVGFQTKAQLSMAHLTYSHKPVAELIGVQPLTFIPLLIGASKDFYNYLHQMTLQATKKQYKQSYGAFQRGMEETKAILARELNGDDSEEEEEEETEIQHQPEDIMSDDDNDNVSVASRTGSAGQEPVIYGTPVYSRDSWGTVWNKMSHSGWSWRARGRHGGVYYIKPNCTVKDGIEGQDYFTTMEQVQDYAKTHYGWKARNEPPETVEVDESSNDEDETSVEDMDEEGSEDEEHGSSGKKRVLEYADDVYDTEENFYVWKNLWSCLKDAGWQAVKARNPLHDWYYVRPGKSVKGGALGEDYFHSTEDVIEYAKSIDFKNTYHSSSNSSNKRQRRHELSPVREPESPAESPAPVPDSPARDPEPESPPRMNDSPARVPDSPASERSETPDDRPQPQDPGIPLLSPEDDDNVSESSAEEVDRYAWPILWPHLKKRVGWYVVKATNQLHDWYYVRPGRSVKGGTLGVDYFATTSDVIEFERNADQQEDSSSQNSPPLGFDLDQEAVVATRNKDSLVDSSVPSKMQWWKKEEVPTFNGEIWPVLRDQLGFRYSNGKYVLPGVSVRNTRAAGGNPSFEQDFFVSEHKMRCYLCKHGIPNFDAVEDDDDKENLLRWVTFANVPVTPQNSMSKLKNVKLISCQGAWKILSEEVGYKQTPTSGAFSITPFSIAPNHCLHFDSLNDVRTFIRSSPSLDGSDAIQDLSRSQKKSLVNKVSPENELKLRLWAATSTTELPVYQANEENAEEEHLEESEQTSDDEAEEAGAEGMEEIAENDYPVQDAETKETDLAERMEETAEVPVEVEVQPDVGVDAPADEMEDVAQTSTPQDNTLNDGSSSTIADTPMDCSQFEQGAVSNSGIPSFAGMLSTQPSPPSKSRRITMDPSSYSDERNQWSLN